MRRPMAQRSTTPDVIRLRSGCPPEPRRRGLVRGMAYGVVPCLALWLLGYFLWRLWYRG